MKRVVLLVLAVVLVLSVVPVMAQDELPTIAEIVVASAEAETPEFTTLLGAVGLADPAVLEALMDPEASLTVFAPTDAAFAALAEELGEEEFAAVLEDTEALTDILLYHVVDGAVMSADVVALLEEAAMNEETIEVETLNGQFISVAGNVEDGITIDAANLVLEMVDIEASNGVIHVIDAVIVPELRTIAEVVVDSAEAEEDAEFTMLLAAVGAADPAVLEALSDPEVALTVFAPTDAAFEALGEETLNTVLADVELLTGILSYHVVDGVFYSWDVVTLLEENEGAVDVEMLTGDTATISIDDMGIYINDAQIILTDIETANGVIHVIDAVILPETE
jgi:transforming growth factor-beta-induced protein